MPNIAITTYCNLHCPYCFADTMINETDIKNIELDQFEHILNWIEQSQTGEFRVGIIGGEPTLHPQFNKILEILDTVCTKAEGSSTLFTNGIYLHKYFNKIPPSMKILWNINTPKAMTQEQWTQLNKNLNKADSLGWLIQSKDGNPQKITLGCNICQEIDNYDFFWDIVDTYEVSVIRMSAVAPTNDVQKANKEVYYESLKEKVLSFVKKAELRNIKISFDCNQIPSCFFSKKEWSMILSVSESKIGPKLCKPVIDITPDFYASGCFGTYSLVDCRKFHSFQALSNYILYNNTVPLTLHNNSGKCKTCDFHTTLACQGGCLAFSEGHKELIYNEQKG